MSSVTERDSRAIFLRFFLSYAAVLLVPLGFATFGYLHLLRALEQRSAQATYVRFSKYTELLDQRFQEMEASVTQLSLSQNILELLDRDSPFADGTVIPSLLELENQLSSLTLTNGFITNVHVFLKRAEVVVSSYHIFFGLPTYYGRYLSYGDLDIGQWAQLIFGRPHQKEYLPAQEATVRTKQEESTTQRMLLYVQSLPTSAYSLPRGAIVAFIPEQEVLRYLGWTGPGSAAHYLITDSGGRPIAGDPLLATIGLARPRGGEAASGVLGGTRVLVSRLQSPQTHWWYLEAVPATVMSGQLLPETLFMAGLLAAALLAGLVLSSLVATRTSKPLANALRLLIGGEHLAPGVPRRDVLDFLQDSVARLVESDRAFRLSLQEQEPRSRVAFLERLLTGGFESEQEARLYQSETTLPVPAWPVLVLLARINDRRSPRDAESLARITAAKAVVRSRAEPALSPRGYVHDADFDLMAILVEEPRRDTVASFAASLFDMLAGDAATSFSFAVGNPAAGLLEIARSTREAKEALSHKPLSRGVVFYADIPAQGDAFYPAYFAPKFISFTLAGELPQVNALLSELRERNCVSRQVAAAAQRQLEYDVRDTLTRLIQRVEERDTSSAQRMREVLSERFDASTTMDDLFGAAAAIAAIACNAASLVKKSHNVLLRDRILEFLSERYADPSLYLPLVAEEFGITKEYLSQFFKEQTGENFSVFLERLRIGRARDLLAATDQKLSRIARQCGYNSLPVFRQAFKRVEGVAPSQFRELSAERAARGPSGPQGPSS